MIKPILRVAAVLVALSFLVAYVLYSSARVSSPAVAEETVKTGSLTPELRRAMVLPSSKSISQPVFTSRTLEPAINLWKNSLRPAPDPFHSLTMGGSKSAIIDLYEPPPTPAGP